MIDLRSDTVTKPTPAMRAAMFDAPVGDDVFGEDPTVNQLERRVAAELGKEAALFVPSGCMANQIAIRLHCRPGDEVLTEATNHIVLWEGGGPAVLSGVTVRTFSGKNGILTADQLRETIRPDDIHSTQTRMICLENTHNRGGGTIYPMAELEAISQWARSHGLAMHLDGARLWNAVVATGIPAREWAKHFDTISVCFSKGLGAPVGSAIVGSKEQIKLARRYRKLFGGAMRQIGFLAAACLYALDHHVKRLADDHAHAKLVAEAFRDVKGIRLIPEQVESNLVWVEVQPELGTAREIAARLQERGVLVAPLGGRTIRACTHLDVSRSDCETAAKAIRELNG